MNSRKMVQLRVASQTPERRREIAMIANKVSRKKFRKFSKKNRSKIMLCVKYGIKREECLALSDDELKEKINKIRFGVDFNSNISK